MGKLSRTKGHNFEREVARLFRDAMKDDNIKRGWQARQGYDAPDVITPYFWIECKCGKRTNISGAIEQATEAATQAGLIKTMAPLAITRVDREKPLATMYLDDFLDLVGAWWDLTNR